MEISVIKSITKQPADGRRILKRRKLAAAIGMASVVLVAGMSAIAAPGGTPGKPDDGGGMAPPDYGDLIIIKRFDNGVPDLDENDCWQPIASDSELCGLEAGSIVPVNPDTCAVMQPLCTEEVDFGRINEARSPDSVFQQQLDDAVLKLATAHCRALDPAGRLVAKTDLDTTTVDASTIDSPLQNLAMYRELVMKGSLGTPFPGDDEPLIAAARALGAASDKSGGVNVDMVAYLNWIMGIVDAAPESAKICQDRKQEVKGVVQLVEECFLKYESFPGYNRDTNFADLPNPPYIPEGVNASGWFEYLKTNDGTNFFIEQELITDAVFQGLYSGDDIGGFAQAADDARAVIDFMHSNPIPEDYETPMPTCTGNEEPPSGDTTYDVYISDVSGLQVPVQIVDGSEGREFTVTVANSGPDAATGTVTVTAMAANGGEIEGSPWTYEFSVVAGASQGFTEFFSINLGERTTIEWEATVEAEFDFPETNNTVTAVSTVKVTGSGGGSGGGQPPGAGGPPNAGGQPPVESGNSSNAKGKP